MIDNYERVTYFFVMEQKWFSSVAFAAFALCVCVCDTPLVKNRDSLGAMKYFSHLQLLKLMHFSSNGFIYFA